MNMNTIIAIRLDDYYVTFRDDGMYEHGSTEVKQTMTLGEAIKLFRDRESINCGIPADEFEIVIVEDLAG